MLESFNARLFNHNSLFNGAHEIAWFFRLSLILMLIVVCINEINWLISSVTCFKVGNTASNDQKKVKYMSGVFQMNNG